MSERCTTWFNASLKIGGPIRINIDGLITNPEEARISILDHGLLFGDSVYETLRTYNRRPFLFSRHFARLEHSARGVRLNLPWHRDKTREEILRTVNALPGAGECRIRVVVTRGASDLSLDIETCRDPRSIIIVAPLSDLPEALYDQGVSVVISTVRRGEPFADLKTGSLIHQVLAFQEAKASGAFEAILLTADGCLSDGITSNVYFVRDGLLKTPSHEAGIVEGITRGVVLDLARNMRLQVVEGLFKAGEIESAEEMFLTSTTREVLPITTVDGRPVGKGRPGPISLRLLHDYRHAVKSLALED